MPSPESPAIPASTRYVTVAEFAHQTGLQPPTVYRMMQQGRIKAIRYGRLRKIPREELEHALIHGIK